MTGHYFTRQPAARSQPREIAATLRGESFRFLTDRGVFSCSAVDFGTRLLVGSVVLAPEARVLDLGCGYGVIGVVAARLAPRGLVVMSDVNARASELARENARRHSAPRAVVVQADGASLFRPESFDAVLCNPPLRAGNAVVLRLIRESHRALKVGGALWLVAQTKQGAKTLRQRMAAIFGNAEDVAIKGGYRVMRASKTSSP